MTPVVHDTLIRAHPHGVPLEIAYDREFNETVSEIDPNDVVVYASERLVAVAEAQACKVLNFTHHVNLAYAFRNVSIPVNPPPPSTSSNDSRLPHLVPTSTIVSGGVCVARDAFENDMISHAFAQTGIGIHCDFSNASLSPRRDCTHTRVRSAGDNGSSSDEFESGLCVADLNGADTNCNSRFMHTRCFRRSSRVEHCVTIGETVVTSSTKNNNKNANNEETMVRFFVLFKSPDNVPAWPDEVVTLRDIPNLSHDDYAKYAANVAFLSAVDFKYSAFNAAFMAVAQLVADVPLPTARLENTTEINLSLAIPALVCTALLLTILTATAVRMRLRFVSEKGREEYVSFANIGETFKMDGDGRMMKTVAKENEMRFVVLSRYDGRPVLVNDVADAGVDERSEAEEADGERRQRR